VIINYGQKNPVRKVSIESVKGHRQYYEVKSRPYKLKLTPGKHALQITYSGPDGTRSFAKDVVKESGKPLKVDLGPYIQQVIQEEKNERAEVAERIKNRGAILLSEQNLGLRVGIFPVDSMQTRPGDGGFGFADRFNIHEPKVFEVPAGGYEIKVSCAKTGWIIDGGVPQFLDSKIDVKPGEVIPVSVSHDYKKLAENQPDWSLDPLFKFEWIVNPKTMTSKRFTLSIQEAKVVQQLLEAFADGKPDVPEIELLKTVNTGSNPGVYKSLKQKFNDGKHPAWGTLIVPGKEKNTYRLQEPGLK